MQERCKLSAVISIAVLTACQASGRGPEQAQDQRPGQDQAVTADAVDRMRWTPREAEHLLNRAAFGARWSDVERAVSIGQDALIEELFARPAYEDNPYYSKPRRPTGLWRMVSMGMSEDEKRMLTKEGRAADQDQLQDFLSWWIERMLAGDEPLRERMTLFWHGFFPSSYLDVRNSHEMIIQNQLLRQNALGSFADLLHGIARDPAMLEYLDNNSNRKEAPNENFARELLELFSLGEGNYTEQDIKAAARAFTGWSERRGRFRFDSSNHDHDEKTFLGTSGDLNGDDVIDIILSQDACARHVARELLRYFEGVEPGDERLEKYTTVLKSGDYDTEHFLRTLFADPRFYRNKVVGARIQSPVDYLVGTSRRLGIQPPARFILIAAMTMGEQLFFPPNVKGWEGGETWITTASLMQRANFGGVLLGRISMRDFVDEGGIVAAEASMEELASEGEEEVQDPRELSRDRARALGELRRLNQLGFHGWDTRIHLSSRLQELEVQRDAAIVDALAADLLAVKLSKRSRTELLHWFADERAALEIRQGKLHKHPEQAEELLRRLAHLMLSLPEAQLH